MTKQFYASGFGMKRMLSAVTTVAFLTLCSEQASAAEGWYTGLGMGASLVHSNDLSQTLNTVGGRTTRDVGTDHDLGFSANLTAGYAFANGLRAEFDLGHTTNQYNRIDTIGDPGEIDTYTVGGNLLYDFRNASDFTPYVGAGLGGIYMALDDIPGDSSGAIGNRYTDESWGFFGKAIAGLTYNFSDYIDIFGQYQLASTFNDLDFKTSSIGTKYESSYRGSSAILGVRYVFNKPTRAPAPTPVAQQTQPYREIEPTAAAVAPPIAAPEVPQEAEISESVRSYLVFFDFDSSQLTDAAKEIVNKAVQDAKSVDVVRLELTGHADRSGSTSYNNALSMRRAKKVKKEVIKLGIDKSLIGVYAKGESDPLVPTPDGVREPQNRRVEIVYRVRE